MKKSKIDWKECKYEGEWAGKIRNGRGRSTWISDGSQYCGEWSNNAFNGKGVFSYGSGHVFHGNFDTFCPVDGILYAPSGAVYSVTYKGKTRCWLGKLPTAQFINEISDEQEVAGVIEELYDALVLPTDSDRKSHDVGKNDVAFKPR
jgi:hypothetical protein